MSGGRSLGSLEPEVQKAGWWSASGPCTTFFPSWFGEHSDTPPPGHQIVCHTTLYLQLELVQICCSQVHLIFPVKWAAWAGEV